MHGLIIPNTNKTKPIKFKYHWLFSQSPLVRRLSFRGQKIYLLARRYPSATERLVFFLLHSGFYLHPFLRSVTFLCVSIATTLSRSFSLSFCLCFVFVLFICVFVLYYHNSTIFFYWSDLVRFCFCVLFRVLIKHSSQFSVLIEFSKRILNKKTHTKCIKSALKCTIHGIDVGYWNLSLWILIFIPTTISSFLFPSFVLFNYHFHFFASNRNQWTTVWLNLCSVNTFL